MASKIDTLSKLNAGLTQREAKESAGSDSPRTTSRYIGSSGVGAFLDATAQKQRADAAELALSELRDATTGERTLFVDPDAVVVWPMHDREAKLAFSDEDPRWVEFKQTIAATGGNRESVKLRELSPGKYELIAGLRRLQAVRQQPGLKLKAEVMALTTDDRQAWIDMRVENEGGEPLSLIEKAWSYAAALEKGLFANQADLAQAVGAPKGNLSTLLSLAHIAKETIGLLGDWRGLTYEQARLLIDRHKIIGADALHQRALAIPASADSLATRVAWLKTGEVAVSTQSVSSRFAGGTLRAGDRKITLSFDTPERTKQVLEAVQKILSEQT